MLRSESDEGNVMKTQKEKDAACLYQVHVRKALGPAVMIT